MILDRLARGSGLGVCRDLAVGSESCRRSCVSPAASALLATSRRRQCGLGVVGAGALASALSLATWRPRCRWPTWHRPTSRRPTWHSADLGVGRLARSSWTDLGVGARCAPIGLGLAVARRRGHSRPGRSARSARSGGRTGSAAARRRLGGGAWSSSSANGLASARCPHPAGCGCWHGTGRRIGMRFGRDAGHGGPHFAKRRTGFLVCNRRAIRSKKFIKYQCLDE